MKLILANGLKSRLIADTGVTLNEIEECFLNRSTSFQQTNSEDVAVRSFSFVSKTDRRRELKIEFSIKNKMLHVLQLPDRSVTIEQDGMFCEITAVASLIRQTSPLTQSSES